MDALRPVHEPLLNNKSQNCSSGKSIYMSVLGDRGHISLPATLHLAEDHLELFWKDPDMCFQKNLALYCRFTLLVASAAVKYQTGKGSLINYLLLSANLGQQLL